MKTGKKRGGRPTKYKNSVIKKLNKYLEENNSNTKKLPTKEGFALYIGVDDETLNEWAKRHKGFSATLSKLMQIQKKQLIDDGIYGGKSVNAVIVKLLLQNNHGMKDKADNKMEVDIPMVAKLLTYEELKNESIKPKK